ncbi:MAG: hypothetical protein M3042_00630 [Actinomycetota bacterium]|nr:hypothetical protein [Actinomycetota bacterium]
MFAVLTEVNVPRFDEASLQEAREGIEAVAVPQVRQAGGTAAYWLAPHHNRGVSVAIFETEEQAREAASHVKIGEQAGRTPDVTFTAVEVLEVLAHL